MKKSALFALAIVVCCLHAGSAAAQRGGGFIPGPGPYPPPYPYPFYGYPYFFSFPAFNNNPPVGYQYYHPSAPDVLPKAKDNHAVIKIIVPSTANDIWVDGVKMPTRETSSRVFISPPLEPGHNYTYTIHAEWPAAVGMVAQDRVVAVRANGTAIVDFNQPPSQ